MANDFVEVVLGIVDHNELVVEEIDDDSVLYVPVQLVEQLVKKTKEVVDYVINLEPKDVAHQRSVGVNSLVEGSANSIYYEDMDVRIVGNIPVSIEP